MSDIVIRAHNLSKRYRIGAPRASYGSLRESLAGAAAAPFRRLASIEQNANGKDDWIWALKDVSFEVKQGEVVGIIGRNGAGKSTLLKVLSRITRPTGGRAHIRGRVGSLLEVGTGFHPELTGRENIYLNGAVLGMKRAEIERKFDEIVDFAEIEKFLDTPVKHFSSGMYMRLAFSVAAHLEPEILLVDEVLAVGDTEFQKKCLGKMDQVSKEGRTVLFVSHNIAAIQQLCQLGIVLNQGEIAFIGDKQKAINKYLSNIKDLQIHNLGERKDRKGEQWLRFVRVAFFDGEGNELKQVITGQDLHINFHYVSKKGINNANINIAFNVRSARGYLLTNLNSIDVGCGVLDVHLSGYFQCTWPNFNLRSGSYDCTLFCSVNGDIVDWIQSAFTILVEEGDFFRTGKIINRDQGDILVNNTWKSVKCYQ